MQRKKETFNITSINREDLIKAGFDGNSVDDEIMECLASKMCDDYVEQLFWIQIFSQGSLQAYARTRVKICRKNVGMSLTSHLTYSISTYKSERNLERIYSICGAFSAYSGTRGSVGHRASPLPTTIGKAVYPSVGLSLFY